MIEEIKFLDYEITTLIGTIKNIISFGDYDSINVLQQLSLLNIKINSYNMYSQELPQDDLANASIISNRRIYKNDLTQLRNIMAKNNDMVDEMIQQVINKTEQTYDDTHQINLSLIDQENAQNLEHNLFSDEFEGAVIDNKFVTNGYLNCMIGYVLKNKIITALSFVMCICLILLIIFLIIRYC